MPDNSPNVKIGVGVDDKSAVGLASAEARVRQFQKLIAAPIKGGEVTFSFASLDRAEKRIAAVRKSASAPVTPAGTIGIKGDSPGTYGFKVDRAKVDAQEQAVRDAMAGIIRGMDRRAKAEKKNADIAESEAEARRRLGLSIPKPSARPERQRLRQQEEDNRNGKAGTLSDAEAGYSRSTFNRRTAEQARADARSMNGLGRGNGVRGSAGGSSGEAGGVKFEDKLNLGAGNKITGELGLAFGGIATAVALTAEVGNTLKSYNDKIAAGLPGTDAAMMGFRELGAKLPIIGGVLDGLDNLAAELNGDAAKQRGRAKDDQKAADNASVTKRKEAIAAAGKAVTDPLIEAVAAASGGNRVGAAGRDDETGRRGQLVQAAVDREGRTRDLANQEAEIRRKGALKGSEGGIDQNAVESNLARIGKLREESNNKFDLETSAIRVTAAKEEVAQRKQTESDVFQTRQAYLTKEGAIVQANLEAVDREAALAKKEAQDRADKTVKSFGANSDQAKDAQNTLGGQLKAIEDRKNVNRSAIIEQAGREGQGTVAGELRIRAALGDTEAAIKASTLVIEQQTKIRHDQLAAIVSNSSLDGKLRNEASAELVALDETIKKQKDIAAEQIRAQEASRKAGVFSDVNSDRIAELRRQGERTGNRGIGLQADAYELAGQSNQRRLDLQTKLAGTTKEDEKAAIKQAIADLPKALEGQIKDLTRSRVGAQDFVNAANAQAADAGALSGLAQNAREDAGIRTAKLTEDILTTLKVIAAAFKNGGTVPRSVFGN